MMVVCGALLYAVIRMSEEQTNKSNHDNDSDAYSQKTQTGGQQSRALFSNNKPPEVETDATISDQSQP